MKLIWTNLKHFCITSLLLLGLALGLAVFFSIDIDYGDERRAYKVGGEKTLARFGAGAVVVGHTPQRRVHSLFAGKVIAINVRQPSDYRGSIPPRSSEGLLIRDGQYFRLRDDGSADPL